MADEIRVLVSGGGRMGRAIVDAVARERGLTVAGVVDGLSTAKSFATEAGDTVPLFADAATALAETKPHVAIDFSSAAWTPAFADACLERGVRMVIGTSSLPPAFVEDLRRRCAERRLGAVLAANFALGAVLLMHMARIASPFFEAAEIIELHHDQKADAPSGTSVETARGMLDARAGRPFARNTPQIEPLPGARGADASGVTIHSIRLPGLVAHQEVLFGGLGQTLSLRHDTTGRESFMPGIILATREVMHRDALIVGLDSLLGLTQA